MEKLNIKVPKIKLVNRPNCGHFTNSHHLQFMFNVYALVKAGDKVKLHLTDELLKTWNDCIELETELNKQATATMPKRLVSSVSRCRSSAAICSVCN